MTELAEMSDESRSNGDALADHAAEIRKLGGRVVADIVEIGRRLSECNERLPHGQWLRWLGREFGWSEWTARNYINVYRLAQSYSGKIPDLRIPASTLYLLARASTPEEARAEAGERVTLRAVEQIISDSRSGETGAAAESPPALP